MPETTMEKAVQPKQVAMVKKPTQPKKAVSIIPSRKEYDKEVHPAQKILRVAAYCRVSTLLEQQESSFEAQKSYYTEMIRANPNWKIAGIYADATCIIGTNQSPSRWAAICPYFSCFQSIWRRHTR